MTLPASDFTPCLTAGEHVLSQRHARTVCPTHLRTAHWCCQDIGLNAGCGEEAYDLRDGEWMCERHIARYDFDIYATAVLDECPEDWDVERT